MIYPDSCTVVLVRLADQVSVFVTYDKRLLDAAAGVGMATASPGAYDR